MNYAWVTLLWVEQLCAARKIFLRERLMRGISGIADKILEYLAEQLLHRGGQYVRVSDEVLAVCAMLSSS